MSQQKLIEPRPENSSQQFLWQAATAIDFTAMKNAGTLKTDEISFIEVNGAATVRKNSEKSPTLAKVLGVMKDTFVRKEGCEP
jgi:hypothetical protein